MTEYICKEVKTDNGGYLEITKELIRCRECKWYLSNYIQSPFDTDGFDRWSGLANCQNENGLTVCSDESYCSYVERKEE